MIPILTRDNRFVVLDKPAGLPVHPGPRGGPSVEDAFPELSRHRTGPWLAHRIDADTAGCLVIALRKTALLAAQAAFAAGTARKTYWAIVLGRPTTAAGRIDIPLRKHSTPDGWRMIADPTAPPASTSWTIRGATPTHSWLELTPHTGRTHQIRAHCALIGHPIQGDPTYSQTTGRLCLLARSIHLPLSPPLKATAPAPPHMRGVVAGM